MKAKIIVERRENNLAMPAALVILALTALGLSIYTIARNKK